MQHFPGNVAVILAKAPLASLPHDPGERQAPYFMLAMVDQATKSKEEGEGYLPHLKLRLKQCRP